MSDGVDGGARENELDSHSSLHAGMENSSNQREDEALDLDSEAALNTNYDSSDGTLQVYRLNFYFCILFWSVRWNWILHSNPTFL